MSWMLGVVRAKGIYFNYFIKAATAATKVQGRHLRVLVAIPQPSPPRCHRISVALMERVSPAPDVGASSSGLVN